MILAANSATFESSECGRSNGLGKASGDRPRHLARLFGSAEESVAGTFRFDQAVSRLQFVKNMENQTPVSQNDALHQKLERLTIMYATMQPSLRGRWIRLIIRETLTVALYVIFWKHEWVRLSLYIVAPLILLNLGLLSVLTWALPRRIDALKAQLGEEQTADCFIAE